LLHKPALGKAGERCLPELWAVRAFHAGYVTACCRTLICALHGTGLKMRRIVNGKIDFPAGINN